MNNLEENAPGVSTPPETQNKNSSQINTLPDRTGEPGNAKRLLAEIRIKEQKLREPEPDKSSGIFRRSPRVPMQPNLRNLRNLRFQIRSLGLITIHGWQVCPDRFHSRHSRLLRDPVRDTEVALRARQIRPDVQRPDLGPQRMFVFGDSPFESHDPRP